MDEPEKEQWRCMWCGEFFEAEADDEYIPIYCSGRCEEMAADS